MGAAISNFSHVKTALLVHSDSKNKVDFTQQESDELINNVTVLLTLGQLEFLALERLSSEAPKDACDAMNAYLNVLSDLPPNVRARTLRAIYSEE